VQRHVSERDRGFKRIEQKHIPGRVSRNSNHSKEPFVTNKGKRENRRKRFRHHFTLTRKRDAAGVRVTEVVAPNAGSKENRVSQCASGGAREFVSSRS